MNKVTSLNEMSTQLISTNKDSSARSSSPILIAIPFYKNEHLVARITESLIGCAHDLAAIGAEVIFYNDSPEYPPLGTALEESTRNASRHFPCRIVTNAQNKGFVGTMNLAMTEAIKRHSDIILLNSDTYVFPGALPEMVRVATLDPMTGFVNPRSNNATLANLPHQERFRCVEPEVGFAAYKALAHHLPDVSYAPTAIGFCMLIRHSIIAEFGIFDEIYGAGYNEENDLVMRAGRCGYRAVLANRAYVWHEGEQSFASSSTPKSAREEKNRAILISRYPEYETLTDYYFRSPTFTAEFLLGTLLPDPQGRIDVALDFSNFSPHHNGTFKAGEQLLREAAVSWTNAFNLYVLCSKETYDFHGYASSGVRRREPHGPDRYAAIFRVGQPYDWNSLERMCVQGANIGFYMLDTISIDCGQLFSPRVFNIWQFSLENSDLITTLSTLTTEQFERRFHYGENQVQNTVMLSLDINDYRLEKHPGEVIEQSISTLNPGFILIVGNHYAHKYVATTANHLASTYPDKSFVSFGATAKCKGTQSEAHERGRYAPPELSDCKNITGINAGELSDSGIAALYENASVIVFPSHYEGFGIPLMNALAMRKPIFVRRLPVFEEIWHRLGCNPNVHFFETTTQLAQALAIAPAWIDHEKQIVSNDGAARMAREILTGINQAIASTSHKRIMKRLTTVDLIGGVAPERAVTRRSNMLAARVGADYMERLLEKVFSAPYIYATALLFYRSIRKIYRLGRRRT